MADITQPGPKLIEGATARPEGTGAVVPEWFQQDRKRKGSAAAKKSGSAEPRVAAAAAPPANPQITSEADEEPPRPWKELLAEWLVGSEARGYAVSATIHAALFLALSIVITSDGRSGFGGSGTYLTTGSGEMSPNPGFDDSPLTEFEFEGGHASDEEPLPTEAPVERLVPAESAALTGKGPLAVAMPQLSGIEAKPSKAMEPGNGKGEGTGKGKLSGAAKGGGGFAMPGGGRAVVKGSFTAWTVPETPAEGQDYLIVIQVEFKESGKRLKKGDVIGTVVGTDGYRLMISPFTSEYLPKANQVVVRIPGAEQHVKDIIKVRSQMLRESQELEIVFGAPRDLKHPFAKPGMPKDSDFPFASPKGKMSKQKMTKPKPFKPGDLGESPADDSAG